MDTHRLSRVWSATEGRTLLPRSRTATRIPPQRRAIERIVVALDGSELAEGPLPHVASFARAFDADVVLVSVIEPGPADRICVDSAEWRLTRATVRAYLEEQRRRLEATGVRAEIEIEEGRASEQILRVAEKRAADLLALCSHGKGGMTEFNLSGTASKVLRAAGCSVFVSRARHAGSVEAGLARYRSVLVPVDCTTRSQWAVHLAAAVVRSQNAELALGTVIVEPEILGDAAARTTARPLVDELMRLNRQVAHKHLSQLAASVSAERLVVRQHVVEGEQVGGTLVQLAESADCSLIVLSAHGNVADTGWPFGSVPDLLLEHASRPVLVLQDTSWKGRHGVDRPEAERSSRLPVRWT